MEHSDHEFWPMPRGFKRCIWVARQNEYIGAPMKLHKCLVKLHEPQLTSFSNKTICVMTGCENNSTNGKKQTKKKLPKTALG